MIRFDIGKDFNGWVRVMSRNSHQFFWYIVVFIAFSSSSIHFRHLVML